MLSFSQTWLPYIYLYGVGGGLFIVGIWLILRHKSLDFQRRKHRYWFLILIGGFAWYAMIHAVVILAALKG
ncbi:MAG: hypothetical protein H8E70_01650 [Candidatus Marinimicrobia bacterium]|nr:hypothetical protein [Candidatus Neomarinimicrobiota bacterium]